jgi:hypothetical protein
MKFPALSQLANAVWSMVAVGSRTVEVNTKTGFALTAGSYSPIKTIQHTTIEMVAGNATADTAALTAVTIAKSMIVVTGMASYNASTGASTPASCNPLLSFPDTTHVRATTANGGNLSANETIKLSLTVVEFF